MSNAIQFESLAEMLAATDAATDNDRTLVAAYWVQEKEGNSDFASQTVNTRLTHIGHGVSNITRTLDRLMERTPKPIIQLQKSGKSKQARKTYKVTTSGVSAVMAMLNAGE